jgi:hypothetical protein
MSGEMSSAVGGGCEVCGVASRMLCSCCKSVHYCSKDHQRENWPVHKLRCKSSEAARSATGDRPGALDPAAWARGLAGDAMYEWFIDCYRMRLDEDYALRGDLHGLYGADGNAKTVIKDFLVFCKMALRRKALPPSWSWESLLKMVPEHLGYAFEKSDAEEKYGSENIFSAILGGRSLRLTAEQIYGPTGMFAADNEEVIQEYNRVDNMGSKWKEETFADVGGLCAWKDASARLTAKMGTLY